MPAPTVGYGPTSYYTPGQIYRDGLRVPWKRPRRRPPVAAIAGPAPLPGSLLAAIYAYWQAAGLAGSIAPLYESLGPAGRTQPIVVINEDSEGGRGITTEDRACQIWFTLVAAGEQRARALTAAMKAAIDPQASGRAPWIWTIGNELGCYPEDEDESERLGAKRRDGSDVWAFHVPYIIFVTGDP